MAKYSSLLVLTVIYLCGDVLSKPETVDHGSHGAEKHKPVHFKGGHHNAVYDYEALIGTRDHDGLKDLPEEERKARLTRLAKSHDANKNGIIEEEELMEWILHSFKLLDHQEADERLRDEDDNGDGKISFPEILKKNYGYTEEEIEKMLKMTDAEKKDHEESDILEMVEEDRKRFTTADLNKDDLLDQEEYIAFSQPYDYPHMHELEMERTMRDMDEDHDGFISMNEFIKADPDDEEGRLSEVTSFEDLDKDKDGKLTSDEMKPWAVFDNNASAKEEVDHLMKECDEDQDGHLSIEEIVKKEEDFVTSSATDYGRHLHFVREEL